MNQLLRAHADQIIRETLAAVKPDDSVRRALSGLRFPGRVPCMSLPRNEIRSSSAIHCARPRVSSCWFSARS